MVLLPQNSAHCSTFLSLSLAGSLLLLERTNKSSVTLDVMRAGMNGDQIESCGPRTSSCASMARRDVLSEDPFHPENGSESGLSRWTKAARRRDIPLLLELGRASTLP